MLLSVEAAPLPSGRPVYPSWNPKIKSPDDLFMKGSHFS